MQSPHFDQFGSVVLTLTFTVTSHQSVNAGALNPYAGTSVVQLKSLVTIAGEAADVVGALAIFTITQ